MQNESLSNLDLANWKSDSTPITLFLTKKTYEKHALPVEKIKSHFFIIYTCFKMIAGKEY